MANMNTLFKKGYLLAGVVMAANMFVANEIKASNSKNNEEDNPETLQVDLNQQLLDKQNQQMENHDETMIKNKKGQKKKQSPLDKLLSLENYFNLFGTLALSGANNYFKWLDYNAGSYCNLRIGCLGWRSKKLFDIVQIDINLNLWRGIGWSIPHFIKFRRSLTKAQIQDNTEIKQNEEGGEIKSVSNASPWVSFLFKGILRGFVSIPLTLHISNFSISISFDSIIWEFVIGRFFNTDEKGGKKNESEPNSQILIKEKK